MPHRKFIDRLKSIVRLSASDLEKLATLPVATKSIADGEYLLREGDKAERCMFLVDGVLCRQKLVGDQNQILAFYVPGDMPDLHALVLPAMDHDIISIGPSAVAFASHVSLRKMLIGSPALTYAFWRETLVDAAMYREAVARLGARDAMAKVAHLICELADRFEAVGLLKGDRFQVPLTQHHVANACGISEVHVSRTMQELRRRGVIARDGRTVVLLDRKQLETIAQFDPSYLHQAPEAGSWPFNDAAGGR